MAELYTWPDILTTLLDRRDLSVSESTWAMRQVMAGSATPSQLGGFLVALRAKGETVDEGAEDARPSVLACHASDPNDPAATGPRNDKTTVGYRP